MQYVWGTAGSGTETYCFRCLSMTLLLGTLLVRFVTGSNPDIITIHKTVTNDLINFKYFGKLSFVSLSKVISYKGTLQSIVPNNVRKIVHRTLA